MRKEFLPFCRPCLTDEDIAAVVDVLQSGWITTGPRCTAFEEAVAQRVGATGSVSCSSGTGAMHCVLAALDLQPGDILLEWDSLEWTCSRCCHEMGQCVSK